MFEQSSYEYEPVATPLKEGDLFHNYEIKNWTLSPRIYKILGISVLANILGLFVFAQTSLLTMKGCDSPLVGRVCQVLDTVYIAGTLFGSDREYIDAAYDDIDLGDAEITFVDVSGITPPLNYPEGYFQLANPNDLAMLDPTMGDSGLTSGIPDGFPLTSPNGGSLLDTTPNIPQVNDNSVDGSLPSDFDSSSDTTVNPIARRRRPRGGRVTIPSTNPDGGIQGIPDTNQVADANPSPSPTVEPTGPVADVELNKRPFVDLGNTINDLLDKKQVNLETPFLINATGKLNKDGKLDPKSFRFTRAESSDPRMLEVVKEAIEAMNASGYLEYLRMVDVKDLSFIIQQDDNNVTALVESQFENELRPKTISSLLTNYINGKKEAKQAPDASQNDKDDLVLLQNAAVTPTGKKVVISFTIPKADIQRMIQRKLAEQKAQPKTQNGNTVVNPNDNTAKN